MADEDVQLVPEEGLEIPDPPPGRPKALWSILKVGGIVGGIVLVECLIAYLYFPSSADSAAMAEGVIAADLREAEAEEAAAEAEAEFRELELGSFSVSAYQPVSNTTLRIDFQLYGAVRVEDEAELRSLMAEHQHRFREQVIVTVRSAELTDFTDAGLGLIKRQILEKTNKTLGKALLQAVIFSEFSFIEQ